MQFKQVTLVAALLLAKAYSAAIPQGGVMKRDVAQRDAVQDGASVDIVWVGKRSDVEARNNWAPGGESMVTDSNIEARNNWAPGGESMITDSNIEARNNWAPGGESMVTDSNIEARNNWAPGGESMVTDSNVETDDASVDIVWVGKRDAKA